MTDADQDADDIPMDAVARVDTETSAGADVTQYLEPGDELNLGRREIHRVTVKALDPADQPANPGGRPPETGTKTSDVLVELALADDPDGWLTAKTIADGITWAFNGDAGAVHSYLSTLRKRGLVARRKRSPELNQYRLTSDGQAGVLPAIDAERHLDDADVWFDADAVRGDDGV